jgi:2-iminobutanoate/2-iminopropanoate deaminase
LHAVATNRPAVVEDPNPLGTGLPGVALSATKPFFERSIHMPEVETSTPANTPTPIGPYSHIAKVGSSITIGGTAGVNPTTGELAGPEIEAQTRQILDSFQVMLESVGSDLAHVVHVNIFLSQMSDFEAMNTAYVEKMGDLTAVTDE